MNNEISLFKLLELLTVDCKDNGENFLVGERLSVIERLLEETPYRLVAREPLALVFAKERFCEYDKVVLLSSHIDCVYPFLFSKDEGDSMRGTFDNSFGNAAVIWNMLNDTLPENVVVAFTGDEEKESAGALQALRALGKLECTLFSAIVLDVTNVGWNGGAFFTIENDACIDIMTAYGIVSSLEQYSGRFAFLHNAEPDESWCYAEYGVPTLSLCLPVGGELHSKEGIILRKDAAQEYCRVLSILSNILCGM